MDQVVNRLRAIVILSLGLILTNCQACRVEFGSAPQQKAKDSTIAQKEEIWVYTSIYRKVVDQLEERIEKTLPDIKVNWYKAGSEEIATRVNTELSTGRTQADIIMTSDPFWYLKLKEQGVLMRYASVNGLRIPREFMDLDGYFTTIRLSTMVMGYNPKQISKESAPQSFKELSDPKWQGKITMGDPLSSGTMFTTTATLFMKYGWDFFKALKGNKMIASGGNSSVLTRVESGEYPVGIVLLENLLTSRENGSDVGIIYPEDGAILIPGLIAITQSSQNPEGAKRFYDFMLSQEGQMAIVEGYMHSPFMNMAPPIETPALKDLLNHAFPWNEEILMRIAQDSQSIKDSYSQVMTTSQ